MYLIHFRGTYIKYMPSIYVMYIIVTSLHTQVYGIYKNLYIYKYINISQNVTQIDRRNNVLFI